MRRREPGPRQSEIAFVSGSRVSIRSPALSDRAGAVITPSSRQLTALREIGRAAPGSATASCRTNSTCSTDSSPNARAARQQISINPWPAGFELETARAELAAVTHEIVRRRSPQCAVDGTRRVYFCRALIAAGIMGDSGYSDIGMLGANLGAQLTNQKFVATTRQDRPTCTACATCNRAGYDPAAAISFAGDLPAPGRTNVELARGLFASPPPSAGTGPDNRRMLADLGQRHRPGSATRQAGARLKQN